MDAAQLEVRRRGITATDIPKLFGVQGSPWRLYAEKTGIVPPTEGTEQMWWASRLQKEIALGYSELYKRPIEWLDATFEKSGEPLFMATPDFCHVDLPGVGGEVKTHLWGEKELWGEEGSDNVPHRVVLQTQWQMFVLGWKKVVVPTFFGGARLVCYEINADEELQGTLAEEARRFWVDHIIGGNPPPMDGSPEASEYLKKRYPNALKDVREATTGEALIGKKLLEAKRVLKEADLEVSKLKNQLIERIGFAKGIQGEGFRATLSDVKGSTFQVTKEPYRMLRVTEG